VLAVSLGVLLNYLLSTSLQQLLLLLPLLLLQGSHGWAHSLAVVI
jgi:hypothetical protein